MHSENDSLILTLDILSTIDFALCFEDCRQQTVTHIVQRHEGIPKKWLHNNSKICPLGIAATVDHRCASILFGNGKYKPQSQHQSLEMKSTSGVWRYGPPTQPFSLVNR